MTTRSEQPAPWEITLKHFLMNEAEKLGIQMHGAYMRFHRDRERFWPHVRFRKINQRVVFVDARTI